MIKGTPENKMGQRTEPAGFTTTPERKAILEADALKSGRSFSAHVDYILGRYLIEKLEKQS